MKIIAFIFFISLAVTSCYSPRYVYSPSIQNIPILHKRNDIEITGFYGGSIDAFKAKGNYNRGFDIHSAWAISNHFAVMLNESIQWEKNDGNDSFFQNDSSLLSYNRNFIEIAAGYFSSSAKNKKLQLQVFGGAAVGSSKIFDDFISNNTHVNKYHYSSVTKIFIQPALVYSLFKNLSTAFSSRFTEVLFSNIRTNYSNEELDNYILDSIAVSPVFFWEPAVNYTFGFKKFPLKFNLQGSISVLLNHRFVEYRSSNIGIGVVYNFFQRKKTKPHS